MIKEEVRATVYTLDMAHEISNLARKLGKTAYFHIKIDTGMERLGFPATEESADLIGQIEKLPNVCLEGMFTHFAKADELDKTFSEEQYRKFVWMRNEVEKRGFRFRNTIAITARESLIFHSGNKILSGAGIALYGLYPSEEVKKRLWT